MRNNQFRVELDPDQIARLEALRGVQPRTWPNYRVGTIVGFTPPGGTGRLAVIEHRQHHPRTGVLYQDLEPVLYSVRYYDPATGLPMVCPDSRCRGQHSCPIHGINVWGEQLQPLSDRDLEHYWGEGLLRG